MVKKIFEFDKIGFKFSMLARGITEREAGEPLGKILAGMLEVTQDENGKQVFRENGNTTLATLRILHGGACAYAISKGLKEPSIDQVADLIEEIPGEKILEMYSEALKSYIPKNVNAPEPIAEPGSGQ